MSEKILLECENLCVGYDSALVDEVSFSLSSGEVVALMGENGSGKSTLLKTFSGIVSPLGGTVRMCGEALENWNLRERARHVALVRMSVESPARMTVQEFVGLGRSPYSGILDNRTVEDDAIVQQSMELLDVEKFARRPVAELSDGERSRVYLAEAVAQQVNVLLLDEPNAFLDIPRSRALFRMLRNLTENRDMGIVVSTHSIEYAESYCDRIMVVNKGRARIAPAKSARAEGLLDWAEA